MSNLILGRGVESGGNCQGILDGSSRGQPPDAALRHALQPRRHFGGGHHIEDAVIRRRFQPDGATWSKPTSTLWIPGQNMTTLAKSRPSCNGEKTDERE